MAVKQSEYVGERIRNEIKKRMLTNGFVIHNLQQRGFKMTEPKFSSKIYGVRDSFTEQEVKEISEILSVDFTVKG